MSPTGLTAHQIIHGIPNPTANGHAQGQANGHANTNGNGLTLSNASGKGGNTNSDGDDWLSWLYEGGSGNESNPYPTPSGSPTENPDGSDVEGANSMNIFGNGNLVIPGIGMGASSSTSSNGN